MRTKKSIFLPAAVIGLCLCAGPAPGQEFLVVGEKVSGSIGFYTPDGKRTASVPVGKHPHELALSPDGRLAYSTDNGILWMTDAGEGGNTISVLDVHKQRKVGVIDLGKFRRPHGIDVDRRTGHLVVTVENPDGLLLIDPVQKKVLRNYDVKGKAPHMVRLDPRGEWAYASNTNTNTVAAVNLESGEVKLIPTDERPQGGAFSHDGKLLYLTNSNGNSISIIDAVQKQRVGTIPTGRGPGRIALTPDGSLLVYNLQAGEAIGFADPKTRNEITRVSLGGPPLSMHLSEDGERAYLGVQSLDKIYVVSVRLRKVMRVLDTAKGSGPDAVLEIR